MVRAPANMKHEMADISLTILAITKIYAGRGRARNFSEYSPMIEDSSYLVSSLIALQTYAINYYKT